MNASESNKAAAALAKTSATVNAISKLTIDYTEIVEGGTLIHYTDGSSTLEKNDHEVVNTLASGEIVSVADSGATTITDGNS